MSHDKIQKRHSSRASRNHHSQSTIISSDKQNQKERVNDQKKRRQMDDLKYVLYNIDQATSLILINPNYTIAF